MLLHQVALSPFHYGGVRAHEGHRVLLDLIAEEQRTPLNTYRRKLNAWAWIIFELKHEIRNCNIIYPLCNKFAFCFLFFLNHQM